MTKKILSTLAGLILLFAVAAPLYAGSILNHEMTVTVPFAFAAGDKLMPPGDYTVQVNVERESVVLLGEGHKPLMLLTIRKESRSAPQRGKLVFQRYGTSFFLAEIWSQDNAPVKRLPRVPGRRNWHATSNRSRFLWSKLARNLAGRAPASDVGDGIRIARTSNLHSETIEFNSALYLRRSK